MASYEVAKVCPRCKHTGKLVGKKREGRTTVHVFECITPRCKWYETTWIVGLNPDGTVQEREAGIKEFPKRSFSDGKQYIEQVKREMERPTGPPGNQLR